MKITLDIPAIELEKLVAPALAEPRISLGSLSWQQYETLVTTLSSCPNLRLSYREGDLEIMTNSPEHEAIKSLIGRLLEIYVLERDIDLYSYGSATFRNEATSRGLEPDESYCVGERRDIPDLAIEVVITSGGINKLNIYQGLGVREVWFWRENCFTLYQLIDISSGYREIQRSQLLPDLDLVLFAQFIDPDREPQMVRAYRQALHNVGE